MKTRSLLVTVLAVLLLSSSVVWGARLIKSQTQTTSQISNKSSTVQQTSRVTGTNQQKVVQPVNTPSVPQDMSMPSSQPGTFSSRRSQDAPVSAMSSSPGIEKEEKSRDGKQYVTMDFDGVDIKVFVKFIADITKKNFILDDKVTGKVTVISPRKMSLDEAYQVFLSVLDVNGFGTVNMGGVIKIVQAADAVSKSIGTSMETPKRREDVLVTQIIPLKHSDANDMKALFQPLLTKGSAQLLAYPQSNILIITDTKSNIKKMMEILGYIDVTGFSEDFKIIPLVYASAADLSTKLQDILSEDSSSRMQRMRNIGARQGGSLSERGKARIIPYERTNSLIVLATANDMVSIESLIKKLDIPTPTGKEDIHVYYLQYARSEDMAKVLTDMPTPAKAEAGQPAVPQVTPDASTKGMRSVGNSDKVKISADKETNSLVIYANPDAYQSIVETIKYLDIPRKQVYVKAMIMEVNQKKDFTVGVQWNYFEDFSYKSGSDKRTGGFMARSGDSFISSPSDIPTGAAFGVMGEMITISKGDTTITFPNFTSFISAMAHDTDVNILSNPQIITMDNKEAEIKVGANVPYLTRQESDTTNLNNTIRTFDYRDVGVTLRLTPLINQQGNIRMELFQENTSLVSGSGDTEYAPTTLKRSAKTTVTVKDGSTMVIGGLIGDTVTLGESGIPLLRSIPILGHLFKTNTRLREKTNLYIFLTPRVIDSEEKASALYKEKYGDMDDQKGVLTKEMAKELQKETQKEQPKEMQKETPKEMPKEQPKEAARADENTKP